MPTDPKDEAPKLPDTTTETPEPDDGSQSSGWFLSPSRLIEMARNAHPVFRWFLVVGGMAALVSTVLKYGASPATLVLGVVVLLFIGIVVFVFASASSLASTKMQLPVLILIYSALLLVIGTATMLFLGAFFNLGLPIREYILKSTRPSSVDTSSSVDTPRCMDRMSAEEADNLGLQLWVGPKANNQEAFKCFTIAADKDYPVAFGQLGWMYELGMVPTGVNCVKSMELYRKGYAKGAVNTAWNIGRLYDLGCGVDRNNHLARCWYEKAQANGLPEATRDLNAMKEQGRYVPERRDSETCPSL